MNAFFPILNQTLFPILQTHEAERVEVLAENLMIDTDSYSVYCSAQNRYQSGRKCLRKRT
jgi:hypothetical protein